MIASFAKMHGCGNDFVVLDARVALLGLTPARAAALADRHTGVGCDQLIVIEPPPPGSSADVFMRIRNPDGAEAGACGNATRCVADLLVARDRTRRIGDPDRLPATAGRRAARTAQITVDMGPARLDWRDIPLARPMDTLHLDLSLGPLADPAAASMGNPHATFFVADVDARADRALGPGAGARSDLSRSAPISASRRCSAPDRIRLRVWERGAGLTLACGSGACAALVNAHRARPDEPARQGDRRWRRAGDRMARRRPRADDRPGRHRLHRQRSTWRRIRHDRRNPHLRLPPERLRERGDARPSRPAGLGRHRHRQHLRRDGRGRAPGAPGDPPRRAANGPTRASSSPAAPRRSHPRRLGRAARRDARAGQRRQAAAGKLGAGRAGRRVSDIMAARETAAHLVTEFAGRARAFVQVQQGCDHRCTFCIIPFGRGPNRSACRSARSWRRCARWSRRGYQEVVLTGVDIA